MIKQFAMAVALTVLGSLTASAKNLGTSQDDVHLTPVMGCYHRTEVENYLRNGNYGLLFKGTAQDGRVNEVWVNSVYTATIAVDQNQQNLNTKDFCVVTVTKNTVWNNRTVSSIRSKN